MINIDETLNEMKAEASKGYDKEAARKLEKAIDRRIMIAAGKVVAAVLLVMALVFACISPVMNALYTNPLECKADDTSVMNIAGYDPNEIDISDRERKELKLGAVLGAYYELNFPYVRVAMAPTVEKKGFSKYEIKLNMIKDGHKSRYGVENMQLEMDKGFMEIKSDPDGYSDNWYRFTDLIHTFDTQTEEDSWIANSRETMTDTIRDLNELPDSCYICLSVMDQKAKPIMELIDMEAEDFELYWAEVMPDKDTGRSGAPIFTGGISVEAVRGFDENGEYIDEITEDVLKDHYMKNLRLISDNKAVLEGMQFITDNMSGTGEEWINDALENAEKIDVLMTDKYCIGGSKKAVLEYLSKIDAISITVDNIRLSSLATTQ